MNVRPAIRNLAIVFAVVLIPVAAHQLWDYLELRRLIAEIESIRAKAEPVTELEAGVGRSPEAGEPQRAGRMYIAAALLAVNTDPAAHTAVAGIDDWLSGATAEPPAGAAEQLQAFVAESSQALALADQAGTIAFRGFPAGTDYSYRTGELMTLSTLIAARSVGLSMMGRADAAVDSALSGLRLRSALRELRWSLVRRDGREIATLLSLSPPSPEALRRLAAALQGEDDDRALNEVLFDRARLIEDVWRRYYGSLPQAPTRYLLPNRGVTATLMRPWITRRLVGTLRVWSELVEAARTPWPRRVDVAAAMAAKYRGEQDERPPAGFGPVAAIRRADFYGRQNAYGMFSRIARPDELVAHRASVVAIAIERYRRDHAGDLPGALHNLVPEYLEAVPLDPMTGQALLFTHEAGAYTVYSVGPDKKDDGGDLSSALRQVIGQGYGRRNVRGADLGIRVVLPSAVTPASTR